MDGCKWCLLVQRRESWQMGLNWWCKVGWRFLDPGNTEKKLVNGLSGVHLFWCPGLHGGQHKRLEHKTSGANQKKPNAASCGYWEEKPKVCRWLNELGKKLERKPGFRQQCLKEHGARQVSQKEDRQKYWELRGLRVTTWVTRWRGRTGTDSS